MPRANLPSDPLLRAIASSLLWGASFGWCGGLFLSIQRHFDLPPSAAVAVGRVSIDRWSKEADYLSALFFFIAVGIGTVLVRPVTEWLMSTWSRGLAFASLEARDRFLLRQTLLLALPLMLAPLFFLTTRKEMWGVLLPLLLAFALCQAHRALVRDRWRRELFLGDSATFLGLVLAEAASWIVFRYLVTGSRIGHIATLFLELIFIGVFLALGVSTAILISRLLSFAGRPPAEAFRYVAMCGVPLLFLPFLGLFLISQQWIVIGCAAAVVLSALTWREIPLPRPQVVRRLLALLFWPAFIFAIAYASTVATSSWIDLFHRGETLGPASDYLRGKKPYSEVFALHGMLEDGLLDAWLMELFGRSADVALTRIAIIGSLALPALFLLAFVMFDSIPLALATVAFGMFTFVDNTRVVFQITVATLLLAGLRRGGGGWFLSAGALAGVTLFYSLDVGLYSIAASAAALSLLALLRRTAWKTVGTFLAGVLAGAAPFVIYLATLGSLGAFFETSFLTIPAVIDAVWSLPYPKLWMPFRDLSLRTLADFVLGEQFRFILNPLLLAIAIIVVTRAIVARRVAELETALIVITTSALLAQRSALGRADFPHQHFAAFLLPPIFVALILMARRTTRSLDTPSHRAFTGFVATAAGALLLVALWVPDLIAMRLDSLTRYRPRISGIGYEDPAGERVRERIELVTKAVARRTKKGDAIFDFSNQPSFYFFTDRANPTRFYQVPITSPVRFQREVLRDLERTKPPLVLRGSPEGYDRFDGISNSLRAQAVAAYIDERYELRQVVRGVELWERKRASRPFDEKRYLSLIRIPQSGDEVARERMVFPAVGSVAGAGGSVWRGDLTVHNMFETPLQLTVRYAESARVSERSLTVSPLRTVTLVDVVGAWFGRPGTRGMLTIRYPKDRRPVATLTGYDTTRPQSRFPEQPLSSLLAATAEAPADSMVIAGAAGDERRRVNVGVVNTGEGAARFIIEVRQPDGSIVGVCTQSAIDENGTFLLVDAAPKLGVPLDGQRTIHVRMLQGSAVAYASVIDGVAGTHYTIPAVPAARR
jgi:hypothetical protein